MHIVADIDSSNLHTIGGTSGSGISLRITRKKSKWKRRCSWSTNLNHRQVISLRWLSGRTKSHMSNDELNMKKHSNLTGDSAVLMNDWAATVWPFGSESEQQLTCWAAISLLSADMISGSFSGRVRAVEQCSLFLQSFRHYIRTWC